MQKTKYPYTCVCACVCWSGSNAWAFAADRYLCYASSWMSKGNKQTQTSLDQCNAAKIKIK